MFSERTINALDLRIRVIEAAPKMERDDPVLLVHGLAGWAENWRDVMPAIAESGRRAIAFDIPGFGQSQRPKGATYFDPERPFYAPLLFAVLDALAIPRVHVAGHSFGGAIAFTGAVWCPERVRSLTLIAPGGLGTDLDRSFRILTLPGMGFLARVRRSERVTREVLYACFHDPRRCSEQLVREAIRYGAPSVPEMVSALRSAVTFRHGVRDDVRQPWIARRERYGGPALVVWGREDRILPLAHLDEARELSARTEAHVIGSCGHFVMAERPAELLSLLLPFLDRSADRAADRSAQ